MTYAKPWKYSDGERKGGQCADCGLPYGDGWADVVVPDEIWELINPTAHAGCGLLCFNCMHARLDFLGLSNVPFQIASGPFCFRVR